MHTLALVERVQSNSFLGTYLPHGLSFITALTVFGIGIWSDRKSKRKKRENLYLSLLRSIHYDYKKNLDSLCQLHAYLFLAVLPSFSLELSRKDALVQTLIPVCFNFELLDRISDGYFELVHIQNRLNHLPRAAGTDRWTHLLVGTRQLIHNDIMFIFKISGLISEEMRMRARKAEGFPHLPEDYLKQKFDEWQKNSDIIAIARQQETDLLERSKFYHEGVGSETQASGSVPPSYSCF